MVKRFEMPGNPKYGEVAESPTARVRGHAGSGEGIHSQVVSWIGQVLKLVFIQGSYQIGIVALEQGRPLGYEEFQFLRLDAEGLYPVRIASLGIKEILTGPAGLKSIECDYRPAR